MIGKTLREILAEKNINVNELSRLTGVSNQTLYSIIKRDNMKIDFEVLLKICSALGVNVERFYIDFVADYAGDMVHVTKHERAVLDAYRARPEMCAAVDKLLGVHENE